MKRILMASTLALAAGGQALAADLPPPMAPPPRAPAMYIPVIPPYNWSGFYVGGNLGAGWNIGGSISDTFGSTFSGSGQTTKFLGGGQVGVNYQFYGGVVIGAEAMFDWLPNTTNTFNATEGAAGGAPAADTVASATFNNRWLTTATGKLGYAWDRVLLYGKAGGAWVGANNPNLTVEWGRPNALQQHHQQFWLDRRSRRRVGVYGQLVSASRIGLYRAAKPDLNGGGRCGRVFPW